MDLTSFERSKYRRVRTVHSLILKGSIKRFSDIYTIIPKTTVWVEYLKISSYTANKRFQDIDTITVREMINLAELFNVSLLDIVHLVHSETKIKGIKKGI